MPREEYWFVKLIKSCRSRIITAEEDFNVMLQGRKKLEQLPQDTCISQEKPFHPTTENGN